MEQGPSNAHNFTDDAVRHTDTMLGMRDTWISSITYRARIQPPTLLRMGGADHTVSVHIFKPANHKVFTSLLISL